MTDEPKSYTRDRVTTMMAEAAESFATHRVREAGHARWLIMKPHADGGWDNIFWTEIVVLEGGHLLVHGDTDCVMFGIHPEAPLRGGRESWRAVVRWMGCRKRPDDHYFLEKAHIGMGGDALTEVYDPESMREDIDGLIADYRRDLDDLEPEAKAEHLSVIEALEEERGNIGERPPDAIRESIYDVIEDSESLPEGTVVSTRMVYAHAALQRLVALFEEEEKQDVEREPGRREDAPPGG